MKSLLSFALAVLLTACASSPPAQRHSGKPVLRPSAGAATSLERLLSEGMTLVGAHMARRTFEGRTLLTSVDQLVPKYLPKAPPGWEVVSEGFVFRLGAAEGTRVCAEVEREKWAPGVVSKCTVSKDGAELLLEFGGPQR